MPDLVPPTTLLGFDYGTHKIGVAVGQSVTATARPLRTLGYAGGAPDWAGIGALVGEWRPDALVVGFPAPQHAEQGQLLERVRRFARQLEGRYRLPVHLVDETLTSREAWSRLGGRAQRDVRQIDALAAQLILETWLHP